MLIGRDTITAMQKRGVFQRHLSKAAKGTGWKYKVIGLLNID